MELKVLREEAGGIGEKFPADNRRLRTRRYSQKNYSHQNSFNPFTFLKINLEISSQLKFTSSPYLSPDNFK